MNFVWSDRLREQYLRDGYTVFRGLLPPSLIRDLRRESDKARAIARAQGGPQAQRLHAIREHAGVDFRPFRDCQQLPALRDAMTRLLSAAHSTGSEDILGVLFEPADRPWSTGWHRDVWHTEAKPEVLARLPVDSRNPDLFNQVNCALYEDSSAWIVPGSHARPDTPEEAPWVDRPRFPARPVADMGSLPVEEAERVCLEDCAAFPGGVRIVLDAGDYAIYRNVAWHLGNYVPYRVRATLHDMISTPAYRDWIAWKDNDDRVAPASLG